jgi:hypothetical protein
VIDPQDINGKDLLRDLFVKAKILFDFTAPQEFGVLISEKMSIGKQICELLLTQIVKDLQEARSFTESCTRLYFTKESHVHALLNIVRFCGYNVKDSYGLTNIPTFEELDYLTQISFEVYERSRPISVGQANPGTPSLSPNLSSVTMQYEYSLRIGFSPGAHFSSILDVNIDQKHSLIVAPRKWITDYIKLDDAIEKLQSHSKLD